MGKKFTLKADLHIHSINSIGKKILFNRFYVYDSVQVVEDILNRAIELDLKIISITDHDTLKGYFKAEKIIQNRNLDIILVPGIEISSKDGHILAYNIEKKIDKGMSGRETIDEIHNQGGIAVAAHPYAHLCSSLKDKIFELNFDAIEGYNACSLEKNSKSISAAKKLKLPCMSSSDAHSIEEIGKGLMLFPEDVSNRYDVIENIKKGNFRIKFNKVSIIKFAYRKIHGNLKLRSKERFKFYCETII